MTRTSVSAYRLKNATVMNFLRETFPRNTDAALSVEVEYYCYVVVSVIMLIGSVVRK
jgi:hypothetical protein